MAFESVRSYVQLASGLGEMTKARALEAAQGLLALPGADEVTRRAVQASTLADQLLEAAKANRDNLVALVQSEVEAALKRADVARIADVEAARTSLAALTRELADLRSTVLTAGVTAVSTASRTPLGTLARPATTGAVSTRTAHVAEEAAERLGVPDVTEAAATTSTPRKSAAKKSPAKKSAAKKSAATKSASSASAAKKSAAKKSAATKTAATTSTSAGSTTKAAAPSAAKKSAAKKSTVKKSAARKSTATTSASSTSTAKKATT